MTQYHVWGITHLNQNLALNGVKTKWVLVSTSQMSRVYALQGYFPVAMGSY